MKILKTAAFAVVLASTTLPCTDAIASAANPGFITQITTAPGGIVMFMHSGPDRTGIPTCGTSNYTSWAFNVNTPAGQAQLSVLLTAYSTGKKVSLAGTGACNDWPDRETVSWITIQEN